MTGYPVVRLREEVAYIAAYLHWSHDDILNLTHDERTEWVRTINHISERD